MFCRQCGASVNFTKQAATKEKANRRTIIIRSEASNSAISFLWLAFAVEFIFAMIMIFMGGYQPIYRRIVNELGSGGATAVLASLFLFCICMMFIQIQRIKAVKKSFICICEGGVYGIAGKTSYITTQPFEVKYEEIIDISEARFGYIKIDAGPYTYGCYVNDPEKVVQIIQENIRR